MHRSTSARLAAIIIATALMTLALAFRDLVNPWLGTGLAAAACGALALFADERVAAALRFDARHALVGVGAGAVLAVATHALYPLLESAIPAVGVETAAYYRELSAPPGPLRALPIVILIGVCEELIWRGCAYDLVSRPGRAVLLSSLLYAVPQLCTGLFLLGAVAAALGTAWAILRWRTGGLWASIASHAVWSKTSVVAVPLGSS